MTPQEKLVKAVQDTLLSIGEARLQMRYFNDSEWPDQIEAVLATAVGFYEVHGQQSDDAIAEDYANLAGVIGQLVWPDLSHDPDADQRLRELRKAVGGL